MRGSLFVFGVMGLLASVAAGPAQGHEQAIAFTEIAFIADQPGSDCVVDGCRFEVAHRLVIHDAESTLMKALGARADLVSDPAAQARFETYVAERFQLLDEASGDPVALTLLGGEVERGYYWVYQEGELNVGQSALLISQTVLMDAIETQTNRVNVKYRDGLETFVFTAPARFARFDFDAD